MQVYDAGSNELNGLDYDINSGILYTIAGGYFLALTPDSSGQLQVLWTNDHEGDSWTVAGNPADNSTVTQPETSQLTTSTIEPVTPDDDVLANLAEIMHIASSDIKVITNENLSAPQEPTKKMRDYMSNDGYNPAAKLNTVTVDTDGYYVMAVNVPASLVGLDISSVKMYALKNSDFSDASVKSSFYSLINGILNYGELTTLTGHKAKTLTGKMLAIGLLQGSQPFSMFLAKAVLSVLTGGSSGCMMTGAGMAGLLVLGLIVRKRSQ